MREEFIISTTGSLDGFMVESYLGICSERVVIGAGFFSEFLAGFTDIFGGRSAAFEDRLRELYTAAIEKIKKDAIRKGANALLGVKVDIDEISGKNTLMFMISAIGTAAKVKQTDGRISIETLTSANKLHRGQVIKHLEGKRVLENLEGTMSCEGFQNRIHELLEHNITFDLEKWISILGNIEKEYTKQEADEELLQYMERYEAMDVTGVMNQFILVHKELPLLFKDLYSKIAEPEYKEILSMFDIVSDDILVGLIMPVLSKYKEEYSLEDMELLRDIGSKIEARMTLETASSGTGLFQKPIWICTCGGKNAVNERFCVCGKEKNGFSSAQNQTLQKTKDFLWEMADSIDSLYKN